MNGYWLHVALYCLSFLTPSLPSPPPLPPLPPVHSRSMEEAESLGDGVVVVSGGKIQAQGTSQDLKALYGIGFHLHVVKAAAPGGGV